MLFFYRMKGLPGLPLTGAAFLLLSTFSSADVQAFAATKGGGASVADNAKNATTTKEKISYAGYSGISNLNLKLLGCKSHLK